MSFTRKLNKVHLDSFYPFFKKVIEKNSFHINQETKTFHLNNHLGWCIPIQEMCCKKYSNEENLKVSLDRGRIKIEEK